MARIKPLDESSTSHEPRRPPPDDGAKRFLFEAADSTRVGCVRSFCPALPRSEHDGASPLRGKWRALRSLGARA